MSSWTEIERKDTTSQDLSYEEVSSDICDITISLLGISSSKYKSTFHNVHFTFLASKYLRVFAYKLFQSLYRFNTLLIKQLFWSIYIMYK